MARNPGKVLCCMFFLAISGVDPALNNTKSGYLCSHNYPIEALRLYNSCIVNEHETTVLFSFASLSQIENISIISRGEK